jgi:hypothetical protein
MNEPSIITKLRKILAGRMSTRNEYVMQDAVAAALQIAGILYDREYKLDADSRIDFHLPEHRVGIECKVKASGGNTHRQLLRYAMSGEFDYLVLFTSRPCASTISEFTCSGRKIPLFYLQTNSL